jgi:LuxR family maltose regulon positive regulatory protein
MELMSRGEITTIARWTGELPEELVRNRPRLALAREWAYLIRNPMLFWSTTEERMERLALSLDTPPESLIERLEDSSLTSERRNILCEFAIMLAFVVRQGGDLEGAISLFEAGVSQLADDALIMKALGKAGLGSVYGRLGAIGKAEGAFAEAVDISQLAGSLFFVVVCTGYQGLMKVLHGQLEDAKNTYRRGIDLLTDNLGPSAPLSGQVWVGLSDIFREQNDLQKALEYVTRGIDRGERVRDYDALREGYATLARVKHALGESEGSRDAIESAKRVVKETQSKECLDEVLCWEARLELMNGNRDFTRRWAEKRGLPGAAFDTECVDPPANNETRHSPGSSSQRGIQPKHWNSWTGSRALWKVQSESTSLSKSWPSERLVFKPPDGEMRRCGCLAVRYCSENRRATRGCS